MSDPVEIRVRSSLQKVIDELEALKAKSKDVGDSFKQAGAGVTDGLQKNVKSTETFFSQLRNLSRRVADQLRGDFKSLISLNALSDALKLSNQLRKSIDETVQLSDTVRKLGTVFGIAGKDFAQFQTKMSEGLGDLGLDSQVAANALKGLSTTPVRGEENLMQYSQTAGMLASVGGQRGQEGEIAKGMAEVIQARGGNVNDPQQMTKLAESLRRVFVQTGAAPTQTLGFMKELFTNMPKDLRKTITDAGLAQIAAVAQVAGPNATKFIEAYLGKSPIVRNVVNAQGGGGIMGANGINFEKLQKFLNSIGSRVAGDPRMSMSTITGGDEDMAEGMVRLQEKLGEGKRAAEGITHATGDLNDEYRESMGLGEAFAANINKVKSALAAPMSAVTQGATSLLSGAAKSPLGAAAVTGGAAITAAALAGLASSGLSGILGKGLGGKVAGMASAAARTEGAEAVFGTKVVPVYVTNVDEIGAGGSGGGGVLGDALGGAAAGEGAAAGGGGVATMSMLGAFAAFLAPLLTSGSEEAPGQGLSQREMLQERARKKLADEKAGANQKRLEQRVPGEKRDGLSDAMVAAGSGAQILIPNAAPASAAVTSPGAAGGRLGSSVPPPVQRVEVGVKMHDPRLKATVKHLSTGSSN